MLDFGSVAGGQTNFVFIGEAGSGKSELAIHAALALLAEGDRPVHFFDLDMTKPLFRSRDLREQLEEAGICFHYEEQFMDAPTVVGGVNRLLREDGCYVVMDVGGDYMGARSIGGYAPLLNQEGTGIYYVINPYRPWSLSMENIDQVLAQILGVSHIQLERLHLIGNPNLGAITTAQDVVDGERRLLSTVGEFAQVEFLCVSQALCMEVEERLSLPVLSIALHLNYPWEGGEETPTE